MLHRPLLSQISLLGQFTHTVFFLHPSHKLSALFLCWSPQSSQTPLRETGIFSTTVIQFSHKAIISSFSVSNSVIFAIK